MRDKLIELIKRRRDPCDIGACPFTVDDVRPCSLCETESLAGHLIANGVTFAPDNNVGDKWIPTDEQMPEFYTNEDGRLCTHGKIVFRCTLDKTVHLGYCIKRLMVGANGTFPLFYWYDDHGNKWENVSHWMPLPEPPKEG